MHYSEGNWIEGVPVKYPPNRYSDYRLKIAHNGPFSGPTSDRVDQWAEFIREYGFLYFLDPDSIGRALLLVPMTIFDGYAPPRMSPGVRYVRLPLLVDGELITRPFDDVHPSEVVASYVENHKEQVISCLRYAYVDLGSRGELFEEEMLANLPSWVTGDE